MINTRRRTSAFSLPYQPPILLTSSARTSKLVCTSSRGSNLSSFITGASPLHTGSNTSRRVNVVKAIAEKPASSSASTPSTLSQKKKATTTTPKKKNYTWGYIDDIGPDKWGQINEEWAVCDTGKKQSPIELFYKSSRIAGSDEMRPTIWVDGVGSTARFCLLHKEAAAFCATKWLVVEPYISPPAAFLSQTSPFNIFTEKSPIVLSLPSVGSYRLKNIHFHTGGSEHVLNGKRGAMEAHFVFALDQPARDPTSIRDGAILDRIPRGYGSTHCVVGVLINEGPKTSPWLDKILCNAIKPIKEDIQDKGVLVDFDMNQMLPNFNNANIFTYDGSLTTPPGVEGIHWIVMKDRACVTAEDWALLEKFQGGPNTRPLQNSNGREVVQFPLVISEHSSSI